MSNKRDYVLILEHLRRHSHKPNFIIKRPSCLIGQLSCHLLGDTSTKYPNDTVLRTNEKISSKNYRAPFVFVFVFVSEENSIPI